MKKEFLFPASWSEWHEAVIEDFVSDVWEETREKEKVSFHTNQRRGEFVFSAREGLRTWEGGGTWGNAGEELRAMKITRISRTPLSHILPRLLADDVFGCIFVSRSHRLHITHPMIASYIASQEIDLNGTFYIYRYTTSLRIESEIPSIIEDLTKLTFSPPTLTKTTKIDFSTPQELKAWIRREGWLRSIPISITYSDGKIIIPIHLAQRHGILYPYYGALGVEAGVGSATIYPYMRSPNTRNTYSAWEDICLGDHPRRPEYLPILSVANFDSAYTKYVWKDSWKVLKDIALMILSAYISQKEVKS